MFRRTSLMTPAAAIALLCMQWSPAAASEPIPPDFPKPQVRRTAAQQRDAVNGNAQQTPTAPGQIGAMPVNALDETLAAAFPYSVVNPYVSQGDAPHASRDEKPQPQKNNLHLTAKPSPPNRPALPRLPVYRPRSNESFRWVESMDSPPRRLWTFPFHAYAPFNLLAPRMTRPGLEAAQMPGTLLPQLPALIALDQTIEASPIASVERKRTTFDSAVKPILYEDNEEPVAVPSITISASNTDVDVESTQSDGAGSRRSAATQEPATISPPWLNSIPRVELPLPRRSVSDRDDEAESGDARDSAAEPRSTGPRYLGPAPVRRRTEVREDAGGYRVTMNLRDEDLRSLLDYLSQEAKVNIVASDAVSGKVTASFTDVRVEEALAAILRMTGHVARREGDFLFVGTPADLTRMDQLDDVIESRIYRTDYVSAEELKMLIEPLLTEGTGKVTISSKPKVDIPSDTVVTGGDDFAGNELIMVRDYRAVLQRVDELVREVDQRPRQVVIEAMILSVNLDDSHRFGINFELFRADTNVQLASGSPLASLGEIDMSNGGLSFGVLNSDVGGFINALDTIGDTNVIAAPRLLCLNKQRAEILIGDQKGFISTTQTETSTTQTVEFLDIGTQLRIRPYISSDGVIRLEVHPELSTGDVKLLGGFALPEKSVTQVTTNIMCRDGATVVIGGLIREDFSDATTQVAGAGSIPLLSGLLSNITETVTRNEIVVLITPRVVHDPAELDGEHSTDDFYGRMAAKEAQRISPIARHHYSDRYYRLAQNSWVAGNVAEALRYAHLSLRFKPRNLRAQRLLAAINGGVSAPLIAAPLEPASDDDSAVEPTPMNQNVSPQTETSVHTSSIPTRRSAGPGRGVSPVRPASFRQR